MEIDIFSFSHYRDYILAWVGPNHQRRGVKTKLAQALRCQPPLISQVLRGDLDLSLEQGEAANRFFNHSPQESRFFILLLLSARAGTQELKQHFESQISEIKRQREVLSHRIEKKNELSAEQKSQYYSSWQYTAIHIATTIPALQSRDALARCFALPLAQVDLVVAFLIDAGLIAIAGNRLVCGATEIFVGSDSVLFSRHHANWRLQALESLDRISPGDLHYSAVASLSRADAEKIKKECMNFIQKMIKTLKASPEETLYTLGIDFFSLEKDSQKP